MLLCVALVSCGTAPRFIGARCVDGKSADDNTQFRERGFTPKPPLLPPPKDHWTT
jgi:hypothetical protein